MKRKSFFKWSLFAFILLMTGEAMAQGVVVYRKNGAPIKVPYSELDSISTYNYDEEPVLPGQESYLNCPDGNHPHLIDLGLPSGTKWACCNVGANKREAYGGYYAWGETEEKTTYDWSTYIHCDGSKDTCFDLGSDIAGTQYDVAHVKWGGSWVMPSQSQINELLKNCTHEWTTLNGVNGRKFTGTNGGVIFLPAAGYRNSGGLGSAGSGGNYWSSAQYPSDSGRAFYLYFGSGSASTSHDFRCNGRSVRPVSSN